MLPPAITTVPVQNKTMEASTSREYKRPLSSYPEHVHEYLQSMLSVEGSVEGLISKTDEDYFGAVPSCVREDELELNLDTSEDTEARQAANKCRHASGTPRNEINSTCKTDEAAPKIRKKRGKLRSSVSRSTVTTKDTCLLGRKEAKRRRNRGRGVARQQSALLKARKSNEVVEIFHNTALKSSNSRVSAKYSKLGRGAKHAKKQNPAETVTQKTREKLYSERFEHVTRGHQFRSNEKQSLETALSNRKNNPRVTADSIQEQNKSGKRLNDLSPETLNRESNPSPRVTADSSDQKQRDSEKRPDDSLMRRKTYQREHTACSGFNAPMSTHNYEMPTVASKLKRSSRSYFGRFNFRNIPFVVSTSVTPSHNLGLNIQQVLSIMKTRQSTDIAPFFIRKVSRSARPVSTFLEQMSVRCVKSIFDLESSTTGRLHDKESSNVKRDGGSSVFELRHVGKVQSVHTAGSSVARTIPGLFCEEKGDFCEEYRMKQRRSLVANRRSSTLAYARNQQRISRVSLSKEEDIGDHKMHITDSHHSKEIHDVLVNLRDQFEEMNTRYEKLQSEVENSDDATLPGELSTLEKELHVKEEEIVAVIDLYKEVTSLKQQMKVLREKSSLVCIGTDSVGPQRNPFPIVSLAPGKSRFLTNATQIFGRRGGSSVYGAAREPPASVQLTALLRQIQTFHKQLQLVS
ncbi:PREDICTED: uncharacterized protein LOC106751555 isoform X2 [Dinoponera quadriceps]|uniref:Uncharacterized protein LOC106751555 isoform X2 n=1 Tax=Dinoponera quadriceps TaxID=609295 RepID=A0A6P3YDN9_DINQU|nr:PREDICTED: uncharacterized protein LOC106751555 isoform X2 [Dinoponera quadriceps]